jgi:GAF domain-containing protein
MRAPDLDARAATAVDGADTVPAVLSATCRALIDVLGAQACAISRLVGELLVQIEEVVQPGRSLIIGQGYVLTDFPLTREVLDNREAKALSVFDHDADPAEAELLGELGYEALLMAPLVVAGETWGLVELYDAGERTFSEEDVERAVRVVARAGARIADLGA